MKLNTLFTTFALLAAAVAIHPVNAVTLVEDGSITYLGDDPVDQCYGMSYSLPSQVARSYEEEGLLSKYKEWIKSQGGIKAFIKQGALFVFLPKQAKHWKRQALNSWTVNAYGKAVEMFCAHPIGSLYVFTDDFTGLPAQAEGRELADLLVELDHEKFMLMTKYK